MSGPDLRVLSYGGGTQSSCLALMSCEGVLPRLDGIVFADTQGEMPETYEYVSYVQRQAELAGIPFVIATQGNLERDIYDRHGRGMQPNPPAHVLNEDGTKGRINKYRCSFDYKRRVVAREVKRLCGGRGAWKRATVEQWIGYTVDEASRMKPADECRCGHKRVRPPKDDRPRGHVPQCTDCGCVGFDPWQVNAWPLIDLRMSRRDAAQWVIDNGHPPPPRSACFFCPNRGNAHWRELRETHPDLWARAVDLDSFVRTGINELRGQAFLHGSLRPLPLVDLRASADIARAGGQESLFDDDEIANACEAGVCFT